jgi:hypothetical protein
MLGYQRSQARPVTSNVSGYLHHCLASRIPVGQSLLRLCREPAAPARLVAALLLKYPNDRLLITSELAADPASVLTYSIKPNDFGDLVLREVLNHTPSYQNNGAN